MKSRMITLVLLLALVLSLVAGCAKAPESKTPAENTPTTSTATEPTKETEKKYELIGDNLKFDPNIPVAGGRNEYVIWPTGWQRFQDSRGTKTRAENGRNIMI